MSMVVLRACWLRHD